MIDIKTIFTQFENKTLPKEKWTHIAHIAVAFYEIDNAKDFEKARQGWVNPDLLSIENIKK